MSRTEKNTKEETTPPHPLPPLPHPLLALYWGQGCANRTPCIPSILLLRLLPVCWQVATSGLKSIGFSDHCALRQGMPWRKGHICSLLPCTKVENRANKSRSMGKHNEETIARSGDGWDHSKAEKYARRAGLCDNRKLQSPSVIYTLQCHLHASEARSDPPSVSSQVDSSG